MISLLIGASKDTNSHSHLRATGSWQDEKKKWKKYHVSNFISHLGLRLQKLSLF
jgi:hypothetical protein